LSTKLKFLYTTDENRITTIGVDEAGRGPLSGPVVAASVFLDRDLDIKINDSKKLSPTQREKSRILIQENFNYGIGIIDNNRIDDINILQATFEAMLAAIKNNKSTPNQYILIDGNLKPSGLTPPCNTIVKGDQEYLSIAAASILAKCKRDNIMAEHHEQYPQYEWNKNKGYGTKRHIELIKEHGPCEYHRMSFLTKILQR